MNTNRPGRLLILLPACHDSSDGSSGSSTASSYTVSTSAGGSISPTSAVVDHGNSTSFTIGSVSGCGGSLSGTTYTTGAITADCTVTADFIVSGPPVTAAMPTLTLRGGQDSSLHLD